MESMSSQFGVDQRAGKYQLRHEKTSNFAHTEKLVFSCHTGETIVVQRTTAAKTIPERIRPTVIPTS